MAGALGNGERSRRRERRGEKQDFSSTVVGAGRLLGGILLVTGLTSLVRQFRNGGAPLPLPFLSKLDPGRSLYWAAAAAGLGLALTFAGWRAAVRRRQSRDFWGAATRVDPEAPVEDELPPGESEAGIRWHWLVPFMIGGFLLGAVLYLEQTWYYANSPYRFTAIGAVLLISLVLLVLRGLWRGVKALVRRWRRHGRRWAAAVRGSGGGRGRRAVLKSRRERETPPESASTVGDTLPEEEAGSLFAPDRAQLFAAIANVLAHEEGLKQSVAATSDDERPARGGGPGDGPQTAS